MSSTCGVEKEKRQGDSEMMPLAWALGCPFVKVMKTEAEGSSIHVWKPELWMSIRHAWGSLGCRWRFHFGVQRRSRAKQRTFQNYQNMVNI